LGKGEGGREEGAFEVVWVLLRVASYR
jgi:hypothetical protein